MAAIAAAGRRRRMQLDARHSIPRYVEAPSVLTRTVFSRSATAWSECVRSSFSGRSAGGTHPVLPRTSGPVVLGPARPLRDGATPEQDFRVPAVLPAKTGRLL